MKGTRRQERRRTELTELEEINSSISEAGRTDQDAMDRIAEVLERLSAPPRVEAPRETFKAPKFDGTGDVDYFITQFETVQAANEWSRAATFLHLRESLKDGAQDCGRPDSIEGILSALKARYGVSPREASTRLTTIRRDPKVTLQEHATEVQKLIGIAYEDLPTRNREAMILETFCNTLGHIHLQSHLLAVGPVTLEAAITAGNEFLQLRNHATRHQPGTALRVVDELDEAQAVRTEPTESKETEVLATLAQALQRLLQRVDQMAEQRKKGSAPTREPQGEIACWSCAQPGHLRRNCPNQASTVSGNGHSLQ